MRTNIEIDDTLMSAAMKAGGYTTKKETVEEGLRLLAQRAAIADIRKLRGKIKWTGSLHEMRQDRVNYDVTWQSDAPDKPGKAAAKSKK